VAKERRTCCHLTQRIAPLDATSAPYTRKTLKCQLIENASHTSFACDAKLVCVIESTCYKKLDTKLVCYFISMR
jgi:hypothetical protein